MSYDTTFKLYYVPNGAQTNDDNRFIPIPQISIEPELLYVNDNVIGYNYIVTLNGYATALNLNTYAGGSLDFRDTIESVKKVKNILLKNNSRLVGEDDSGDVIVAENGLLQSLTFEETENNWFNYARYSAQLSFNSLFLADCSGLTKINCSTLPSGISNSNSPYLTDMQKYKVKSVKDNWTIDVSNIHASDTGMGLYNEFLDVTYNIEAVGKSFVSESGTTKPAWEQAKSYCISRLKQEITRLNIFDIAPLVSTNHESMCSGSINLNEISSTQNISLLYLLDDNKYTIYNETINCNTSESEGSFSLEYKSIIKMNHSGIFSDSHCLHNITVTHNTTDDGNRKNKSITVDGAIQGLIKGGLLTNFDALNIPDNGFLVVPGSQSENKYKNAKFAYDALVGGSYPTQLSTQFVVDTLGITKSDLDSSAANGSSKPLRKSHNVVHNYNEGTINYTESYDNQNMAMNSGIKITNASVNIEDSLNMTAEFIIPGRASGPIIQKMDAIKTPKKITLSIDGNVPPACFNDINTENLCDSIILPSGLPASGLSNYEITENRFNLNYNDGSYTLNRTYIYIG